MNVTGYLLFYLLPIAIGIFYYTYVIKLYKKDGCTLQVSMYYVKLQTTIFSHGKMNYYLINLYVMVENNPLVTYP